MKKGIKSNILYIISLLSLIITNLALLETIWFMQRSELFALTYHFASTALFQIVFILIPSINLCNFRRKTKVFVSIILIIYFGAILFGLIALRYYTIGVILYVVSSTVWVLFFTLRNFSFTKIAESIVCILTIIALSFPYYFIDLIELNNRNKTVDIASSFTEDYYFMYASKPSTIYDLQIPYHYSDDEDSMLLIKSIQGYMCTKGDNYVYLHYVGYDDNGELDAGYTQSLDYQILSTIVRYYPDVNIVTVNSVDELLSSIGNQIHNYITVGDDISSKNIGVTLCNQLDAIVLPNKYQKYGDDYGWKNVFCTAELDDNWLVASPYFDNINKSLFILCSTLTNQPMIDYAVFTGCWYTERFSEYKSLESHLKKLDRNFCVIANPGDLAENGMVNMCIKYSGMFVFTGGEDNLATLSSFRIEDAKTSNIVTENGTLIKPTAINCTKQSENKHTVCIMLSDGDNMRFCAGEMQSSNKFFNNTKRGDNYTINYGFSGAMLNITPISAIAYYEKMYSSEDCCMQLSSIGYTIASHWEDNECFEKVLSTLDKTMQISNNRVVELMEDTSYAGIFDTKTSFASLQSTFDKYTALDSIDGLLVISQNTQYSGYRGAYTFSNNKPVISAKYSLWATEEEFFLTGYNHSIESIADCINNSSTDITSMDGYSFIIVHVWSGLDEKGNYVTRGNTIDAVTKLIDSFDDDVEVVGVTEFINRISANVEH